MTQTLAVWNNLDMRRRVIVILATLAMFGLVLAMSRLATAPQMGLLYSGLEQQAAGDVVTALEARGIRYDVRGNAIFVDTRQRDALRMSLAGEGLPANGTAGYELLDNLSGFGTTSQMFDAAYWRAKEGELARTIAAGPYIRSARVHIANSSGQPFRRDLKPTASVTVTPAQGALAPAQANALRYLVASSVAGLAHEDVSVIDGTSGMVVSGDVLESPMAAGSDRAELLRRNVERLLGARMGPGRAVVEVTVETVTEREQITERRFDPEGRVAISTETEELSRDSANSGGGAVTVASNLAEDAAGDGGNASSSDSELRERVNYEVSETQRELLRSPGAIARISVAVLLDGVRGEAADGSETWSPLPEAELEALRELVESAVGFNTARGDAITLKSMPFQPVPQAPPLSGPGLLAQMTANSAALVPLLVLGLVLLVLGLFVVRPILSGKSRALPPAAAPLALGSAVTDDSGLTGEIEDGPAFLPRMATISEETAALAPSDPSADPVDRLRAMIEERREETVEILRHWLEDEEPA